MKEGRQGFSLMEALVGIAIITLALGLSAGTFGLLGQKTEISEAAEEILGTLRLAQNKTLASEGQSSFGVNFSANQFTLFKGIAFNSTDSQNEIHNLSSKILISEINLNNQTFAVFERLNGATQNPGYLKLQVKDSAESLTIFIDASGTATLSSSQANDETRLKDSRHVHALFSQNTKGAISLTLYFPASAYTKTINYQDFLNAGKTEFFWEGEISVNGRIQKLKIHSHSLSDSATLFCFHRDRRRNSEALNTSLDGQNLINYASGGEISTGSSAWAGEPQIQ